jgi:hypothetical protein
MITVLFMDIDWKILDAWVSYDTSLWPAPHATI